MSSNLILWNLIWFNKTPSKGKLTAVGKLEELGEQSTILKASGLAAIGNLRVRFCLANIGKTNPRAILKASGIVIQYCTSGDCLNGRHKDQTKLWWVHLTLINRPFFMCAIAGDEPSSSSIGECDKQVFSNAHMSTKEQALQQASIFKCSTI